ncbi:MAG: 30S ribosomal protein S20 [Rhodospirillaceae bacterium TMED8]|nr:30S ribosomal protein S20 [Magnetovibrio sp.]OUT50466.1 MAG: 30S ribosomal protein S20 [Rhodospirillaceae bacterium TMED8]|tara:strand:+ start:1107 stop:1373 length:267 start_codon:yes stop_codon:yes gene_type:complete
MANHASSKKRIRQSSRRTNVNRSRRGPIRTCLRAVEEAILGGNRPLAETAFKLAEPQMARGVNKGLIHRNTLARKLSRLSARIKMMET